MSPGARALAPAVVLGALLSLAGCASLPAYEPPVPRGPTPVSGTGPASVPVPSRVPNAAARVDTTPSREALDVLASIPEPLAPGERVPAPALTSEPATGDSAREADTDTGPADVPVPEPTPVLGERPLPEVVAPQDTTSPPAAPAPRALVEPLPAAVPGSPAARDTCWRVQIAASAERAKAGRYLEAGRSQLPVPLRIEEQKGLFKVRTRDCLSGPEADALRRRALGAGFDGAFRFREGKP